MAMSLEERADPSHGMLIVVDMQNDFCHRQGAACKRGRDMDFVQEMIPRLDSTGWNKHASMIFRFVSCAHPAINGPTHRYGPNSKIPSCSPAPKAAGAPNFTPV